MVSRREARSGDSIADIKNAVFAVISPLRVSPGDATHRAVGSALEGYHKTWTCFLGGRHGRAAAEASIAKAHRKIKLV